MKYNILSISYMSGTGNSFRAAKWMEEVAVRNHMDSEVVQISTRRRDSKRRKPGSLLGMIYPTYGFTAPWNVIRHTLLLPWGRGRHAYVVATKGALMLDSDPFRGFEGTAAYLIAFLLLLKGYFIRGVMGLDMPANMINVHSGLAEEDARMIIDQARTKTVGFMERIINGRLIFKGVGDMLFGLLLLPVEIIYLLFVRFSLTRLFFASDKCTGCGLCARCCPKHAIKMLGRKRPRPYWKLSCESCMRCMGYCPNRAIEASHLFAIIICVLISIPLHSYLISGFDRILNFDLNDVSIRTIIRYLCFLFTLSSAYVMFNLLARIPMINRLFTYTTFTRVYRRYHEPDTLLVDLAKSPKEHS